MKLFLLVQNSCGLIVVLLFLFVNCISPDDSYMLETQSSEYTTLKVLVFSYIDLGLSRSAANVYYISTELIVPLACFLVLSDNSSIGLFSCSL